MSSTIYTAHLKAPDTLVYKLGACENSSDVASQLIEAFSTHQPEREYLAMAQGQASVFAYMMTGQSAMALIEREMTRFESVPYRKLLGTPPFAIRVAICAPVSACVYVQRANPLPHITLQQLSKVFTRGNPAGDYSSWAQLNAANAGSLYPLRLPDIAPLNVFMSQHHFNQRQPGWSGEYVSTTDELLEKLASMPTAIGIAEAGRENSHVRALPISDEEGRLYDASLHNMRSGDYPLTRYLHLYLPKDRHGIISQPLIDFASFVLSAAGQQIINTQSRYASLSDDMVSHQSNLLANCL